MSAERHIGYESTSSPGGAARRASDIETDLGEEVQQSFLLGGNVASCLLAGPRGEAAKSDGFGHMQLRTTVGV